MTFNVGTRFVKYTIINSEDNKFELKCETLNENVIIFNDPVKIFDTYSDVSEYISTVESYIISKLITPPAVSVQQKIPPLLNNFA